jgi:hypothetical protein
MDASAELAYLQKKEPGHEIAQAALIAQEVISAVNLDEIVAKITDNNRTRSIAHACNPALWPLTLAGLLCTRIVLVAIDKRCGWRAQTEQERGSSILYARFWRYKIRRAAMELWRCALSILRKWLDSITAGITRQNDHRISAGPGKFFSHREGSRYISPHNSVILLRWRRQSLTLRLILL